MSFPWIAPSDDPALASLLNRYKVSMDALPPRIGQAGQFLLERISTENWFLEWNLPFWLGETFELAPAISEELILGNVYGLAYVRLQDDMFDGEPGCEWDESIGLATALYNHWVRQYLPLFERKSIFWEYFDHCSGQWLRAILEKGGPTRTELRSGRDEPFLRLAERGAPLKVCCVSSGLLAGREAAIPPLSAGIAHLLAGMVLVDHAEDWQPDLAAGRYNAFVAFVSPTPEVDQDREAVHRAVLEELYLGEVVSPYFDLAQQQFRRAIERVQGLQVRKLEAYLAWVESETATYAGRLEQEIKQRLRKATEELLQST